MNVTLKQVDAVMDFFQKLQSKYGHTETGNVTQLKWDMRAIAQQMDSGQELQELIQFFMLFSEDRSLKFFTYKYDEYRETMNRVKADRLHRRYLAEQTIAEQKLKEEQALDAQMIAEQAKKLEESEPVEP